MLFNSISFAIFFPLVTVLYFVLPYRARWLLLLTASCYFYMAFIPSYILILAVTIVVDYWAGIFIEKAAGRRRKLFLAVSLVSNVGFLFFFKYFNFFNHNLSRLAEFLDWNYPLPALEIILPIGLSFHTFQAMSYTIEVYRGHQRAERHFGIFALYVLFYPQLVAGPIERPQNLLHQFYEKHDFDRGRVESGLRLMLWGMLKKVVIADRLAVVVNPIYNSPSDYHGLALLVATLFFSFQIYCDFSGYSDIARGAARVMGFRLMLNFNRPYFARSISEFWKRWHISLSTWFKDYLYIPLGGNRVSTARNCLNLLIVFLVSGLWHGANWTYVIWGALHGLFLITSVLILRFRGALFGARGRGTGPSLWALLQTVITFGLVTITWVWFRANSVPDAVFIFKQIGVGAAEFLHAGGTLSQEVRSEVEKMMVQGLAEFLLTVTLLVLFIGMEICQEQFGHGKAILRRFPLWARWVAYEAGVLSILFLGEFNAQHFIYFQF